MARPTLLACLLVSACSVPNPWFGPTTGDSTATTGDPSAATTSAQPTGDPTTSAATTPTTSETTDVHTSDLPSTTTAEATTTTSEAATTTTTTTTTTTDTTATSTSETSTGEESDSENNVDLKPCDDNAPSLLVCYDFENEQIGFEADVLLDGSTYQHNGVMLGPEYFPGIDAQALKITGSTEGFVIDKPHLNPGAITMSAWVRLADGPSPEGFILEKQGQYSMSIGNNGLMCTVGIALLTSNTEIPPDAWTHVACTYTEGQFRLYINGVKIKDVADDFMGIGIGPSPLRVGCGGFNCSSRLVGGQIDRVRLWNFALDTVAVCAEAGQPCG
jgi:hypothetical protein